VVRFRPDAAGLVVVGLNGRGYYQAQMPPPAQRLIPAGSAWRYNDGGTNLGSTWRLAGFDDGNWPSGAAMLGFGDLNGQAPTTTVSNRQQITCYFRRTFSATNTAFITNLTVRLVRDDGAAIYLNGAEVWRDNLPASVLTWLTRATNPVGGAEENQWFTKGLDPALLVEGVNTLAAEVHQVTNSSSDLAFDFELTAVAAAAPAQIPSLTIRRDSSNLALSWPEAANAFRLQSTPSLASPPNWSPWSGLLVTNAGRISAPVISSNTQRFFRLIWP